jgi:outer membrane murein-binding lipoprotein Lpp
MKKNKLIIITISILLFLFVGCNGNQETLTEEKHQELQQVVKTLNTQIDTLNSQLADADQEIDELAQKNAELQKKIDETQKQALYFRGITDDMINLLWNTGRGYDEMLDLTDEELEEIFAPGAHLDGYGYDISLLSEEKRVELENKGIGSHEAVILTNLGYSEEEIFDLTEVEYDFIFPNYELTIKLNEQGLDDQTIEENLNNGISYHDMIKEILGLN